MSKLRARWIILLLGLLAGITIRNLAWGQQQPSQVTTRADVTITGTPTQLCPINGSRIDCSCTNNDAGVAFRVGDVNVAANRGQRVPPGGTFKATTTSAVFGASEGANLVASCSDQSR